MNLICANVLFHFTVTAKNNWVMRYTLCSSVTTPITWCNVLYVRCAWMLRFALPLIFRLVFLDMLISRFEKELQRWDYSLLWFVFFVFKARVFVTWHTQSYSVWNNPKRTLSLNYITILWSSSSSHQAAAAREKTFKSLKFSETWKLKFHK